MTDLLAYLEEPQELEAEADHIVQQITAAANTILDIDVIGRPRPKGSMRHVGHGRMVEQVKASPDWRRRIAETAYERVAGRVGIYPSRHAVAVTLELRFDAPTTQPKWLRALTLLATSRLTGDIDKHSRNVLDALVDAGVIKDDSLVIQLTVAKRYALEREVPGARIRVETVGRIERDRTVA